MRVSSGHLNLNDARIGRAGSAAEGLGGWIKVEPCGQGGAIGQAGRPCKIIGQVRVGDGSRGDRKGECCASNCRLIIDGNIYHRRIVAPFNGHGQTIGNSRGAIANIIGKCYGGGFANGKIVELACVKRQVSIGAIG